MNKIRTPEDNDRFQANLRPIDEAFRESEKRWGVGRLERLVSPTTFAAYKRGWALYRAALDSGDGQALESVGPKMIAALSFMDAEATAAGHQPLDPLVWETPLGDTGTVLVLVRTTAEATAIQRQMREGNLPPDLTLTARALHEGRSIVVYTMREISLILSALEDANAVKSNFPGAQVVREVARPLGTPWQGTEAFSGVQQDEGAPADHARSGRPINDVLAV